MKAKTPQDLEGRLREIIGQLAGSASLCWRPKPTGVFDPAEADKFVDDAAQDLTHLIEDYVEMAELEARINEHRLLRGIFEMVGEPLPERTVEAFEHRSQTLWKQLNSKEIK